MELLIDGAIFGLQRSGGISRYWADLLLQLDASPYSVALLLPTNQNVEWATIAPHLRKIQCIHRKRFRWGKTKLWQEIAYLTAICHWYRPRIWHSSYYVGFPLGCPSIPRMISYHDMIAERIGSSDPYTHRIKHDSLQMATHIFAPSHHAKEDLLDIWPHLHQPIEVIPHGFTPKKILEVFPSFPYFLYLGKREGYKSFQPTVESILQDPTWNEFHIIALGGESQLTFTHPRIHYLGTRSHAEVLGWIQKASLLLMPSLYEGFGYPILEAFSLGTLVLARRSSSIPEITGNEYPLWSHQPLSELIQQLFQESSRWITYGYHRATLFRPEAALAQYYGVYKLFVNKSHL